MSDHQQLDQVEADGGNHPPDRMPRLLLALELLAAFLVYLSITVTLVWDGHPVLAAWWGGCMGFFLLRCRKL